MGDERRDGTARGVRVLRDIGMGMLVGCFAGIPQVIAAQVVGALLGRRERADIAPRLMQNTAKQFGESLSRPLRWLLATIFHFGYGAGWGAVYAATHEAQAMQRVPAWLSGGVLGLLIYAVAFSRVGAGTLVGAERHPDRRENRELAVQWTSALSFALTLAYAYRSLRGRS
jgi:hypothetical protein